MRFSKLFEEADPPRDPPAAMAHELFVHHGLKHDRYTTTSFVNPRVEHSYRVEFDHGNGHQYKRLHKDLTDAGWVRSQAKTMTNAGYNTRWIEHSYTHPESSQFLNVTRVRFSRIEVGLRAHIHDMPEDRHAVDGEIQMKPEYVRNWS